jgi:polyribonucleotide nucleotidyltransferase
MIEAMAYEDSEEAMGSHLDFAMKHIAEIEAWQKSIIAEMGKQKLDFPKQEMPAEVIELFKATVGTKVGEIFLKEGDDPTLGKQKFTELEHEWDAIVSEKFAEQEDVASLAKDYLETALDDLVHEKALKENRRADGRAMNQVRPLFAKAGGISPMLHGTGIFYRGQTHVLSVLTLGGPETALTVEGMEIRGTKRFMHHYNFPPYSAGETGPSGTARSAGRRRHSHHGQLGFHGSRGDGFGLFTAGNRQPGRGAGRQDAGQEGSRRRDRVQRRDVGHVELSQPWV